MKAAYLDAEKLDGRVGSKGRDGSRFTKTARKSKVVIVLQNMKAVFPGKF